MLIDVDKLRDALVEDAGTAAFSGSPFAMGDVVALESASPEELIRKAESQGWDLTRFAAEG